MIKYWTRKAQGSKKVTLGQDHSKCCLYVVAMWKVDILNISKTPMAGHNAGEEEGGDCQM